MTIQEILRELKPKKKLSVPQLYVHIKRAGIKPLGGAVRQIPQQYPADTPQRILLRLGLTDGKISVTPAIVAPKLTAKNSRR